MGFFQLKYVPFINILWERHNNWFDSLFAVCNDYWQLLSSEVNLFFKYVSFSANISCDIEVKI